MNIKDIIGSKIYISPYNDISLKLRDELDDGIEFIGFVDSYKSGANIISPEMIGNDYDYVVIHSPNHWRAISENFDGNKVLLYKKMDCELVALQDYVYFVESGKYFDILLMPFNKSNVTDLSIVHRELKAINISSALIDIGSENNENLRQGFCENKDVDCIHRDQVSTSKYKGLMASIDWDSGFGRPLIKAARDNGLLTIGIVDGIEDFDDTDYNYERDAYNTVEYVLLLGVDDQKKLTHKIDKTSIIGLPKLWKLYNSSISFPRKQRVMINVNFTYGTYEEVRDGWVGAIVEVCQKVGIDYIISQHHADHGVFHPSLVSQDDVYDTIRMSTIVISRFSTVILESLAMGKPVIYFNPHGERVHLYKEPLGAYKIATTSNELESAIRFSLENKDTVREKAYAFLDNKCNISSGIPPGKMAAYRVKNLLEERDGISFTSAETYGIDPRYAVRNKYHHYDDMKYEDEWQLEVYLHALGLMVKNNFKSVADIGCGSGFKLITYLSDYHTIGYELDMNVSRLKSIYPTKDWRVSNFENNRSEIDVDVIICSDVVEHLVDPDLLMEYLSRQNFKYLLISTPDRNLVYGDEDPAFFGPPRNYAHQREWSYSEFNSYVSRFFKIIDHRIVNYYQATQLIICKNRD
ncbi:methyltransferase domain-containing protein [Aeromonas veronii]|uniref:methyltransferase domain-containing protein n=1 Tax=Aeromonas veronii TaxID=654 RepID=UPI0011161488|nr:methyltransferase domain-containing protein [Aeromonas veronii]TNI51818.1 exopolysaccharide biosynthesis protein [Aeromonas veronii]TNI54723.1 exopolysaccharide biosynthesis protein [Aeromonas veronii]